MSFAIAEIERRLANLIRLATVTEADYRQARVRVRVGELVSGWLPWSTRRAAGDSSWWAPEVGEQVILLAPGGDLAQAVVSGALFQAMHPAPATTPNRRRTVYADGAVIEYDREAHRLTATLPPGGTVRLVADGGLSIEGDVTIAGDLRCSGDVADGTRSLQADREIYNAHTHAGVEPGPGATDAPGEKQ